MKPGLNKKQELLPVSSTVLCFAKAPLTISSENDLISLLQSCLSIAFSQHRKGLDRITLLHIGHCPIYCKHKYVFLLLI